MKPSKILKGSCTVVGAVVLGATVIAAALFAFTSFEVPQVERYHHA